jgi:hypothetical protein
MVLPTLEKFLRIRINGSDTSTWDPLPYVLAWEIENHFLSDALRDRSDQLTEKKDLPSKMTAGMTFQAFQLKYKRIFTARIYFDSFILAKKRSAKQKNH